MAGFVVMSLVGLLTTDSTEDTEWEGKERWWIHVSGSLVSGDSSYAV
jgi:uncharacterized membrane protein YdcZ (DUF606 family)